MRVSASRRQVLEALYAAGAPAAAPRSSPSDGDLASVYRNLDVLEELGLVRHVHLGHGPGLYSLAAATTSSSSPASAAAPTRPSSRTGWTPSATLIERELGYRPRFTHFPIVGVCAACPRRKTRHAHS